MTSEEKRLMEEHRDRQELRDLLEETIDGWRHFAMKYHGQEFSDGEHSFGVLTRELHEAQEKAKAVDKLITDYEETCIGAHCYDYADYLLWCISAWALDAAEEFAQLAAVAQKTKLSWFITEVSECTDTE